MAKNCRTSVVEYMQKNVKNMASIKQKYLYNG